MKVIFIEDFKTYKSGDVLNFKKGYVRNYLISNFKVILLNKKFLLILNIFKNLIINNDIKKKFFLKKLYTKFNNKNIYIYDIFLYKKKYLYKWFLKKIGFFYYNYNIIFLKKNKDNYIFNVKIYNNIFIKFFVNLIYE